MDCGGEKPAEGIEEMGLAEKYHRTGRINQTDVGNLIQGYDTGSFPLWVEDVGDDPLHGPGPGVILE